MGTNPLGSDTANLSVNIPVEMRERLRELAAQSGMSLSAYCRMVISAAVRSKMVYRTVGVPTARPATSDPGIVAMEERGAYFVSSVPPVPESSPDPVADKLLADRLDAARGKTRKRKA